jgi:multidrug resistance efflux pump
MQVKKGDPIFQLDNKDLKIATENARLASATADYKLNADKLQDAGKAIDMATKKLTNDSLLYHRQKNLWSNNIGSKVELEQRELSFENAKVDLARASTNYQDLKRQLKLLSDQSKNNLEIAKLMEDDFIIRSEVDGVVYKVNKEEGELTNGIEPEAIIGTDEFIIELSIDELDIVKVKKGQQVLIRMDSYKDQVFEAEIITIDPMMNTRTRSFQAEAIFTKKPGALFPNLTAEANILINTKEDALTIPRNYLINDTYVMLAGGTLQKVETGLMDYDLVEIKSGIDKTTRIELPEE